MFIQICREFHGLSESVITFPKMLIYSDNLFKIPSLTISRQGDISQCTTTTHPPYSQTTTFFLLPSYTTPRQYIHIPTHPISTKQKNKNRSCTKNESRTLPSFKHITNKRHDLHMRQAQRRIPVLHTSYEKPVRITTIQGHYQATKEFMKKLLISKKTVKAPSANTHNTKTNRRTSNPS